ncbi:lantibiotic dehydratase [Nocardia brasiliensis]|uniref:lantibiotic dehydratase n=1 Tax=Nocardia brasiliensis TaxID=37326 RepID=UPI0024561F65|nr:lantibiotic dehydratase [Nocardia brasiliensis]
MATTGSNMYRPLDWLVVRTPLLPLGEYLALGADPAADWPARTAPGTLVPADPRVQRALAVGGGELLRALERPCADGRARQRLAGKLQRYLIRMSSRPTPFGMFAGVGLAGWGPATDLELADAPAVLRTRPDMGWLLDFVQTLEQRDEIRAQLRLCTNPAAFVQADRVFLSERTPIGEAAESGRAMSLRATTPVRRALERARTPTRYCDLVEELAGELDASADRVGGLLDQLCEQTLLLTDLRPPVTAADPAGYVARRLAEIPAAGAAATALGELLGQLGDWDRLDHDQAAAGYPKLLDLAHSVHAVATPKGPFQTDMSRPFTGRQVHAAVATEAVRAAELTIRLSSWPTGTAELDSYRAAFTDRYGPDREVGLLELLDPEIGLGAPRKADKGGADDERRQVRHRTLTDLALDAIRERKSVVELDAATIAKLELQSADLTKAPASLDLSLFVVADSAAAVDAGEFQVVVGPNLGASTAGRVLGRFADLIGPSAEQALHEAAAAEAQCRPGRLWAEVSYLPRPGRLANVTIRPLAREWELPFDTTPGARAERVIPLSELVVGLRDGRFVVRWPRTGQEVLTCAGHMLNAQVAPAVVRFLDEINRDGRPVPMTFDWGPATGFPFLPRVQAGRVVLAPARWRLSAADLAPKSAASFAAAFTAWRQRWQPPRQLYLAMADHRLLLDLDAPDQVEQIRDEARRTPGGNLYLEEALPGPGHAWLPGPDGHYLSELVVPLVRTAVEPEPEPVRVQARSAPSAASAARLRPPGSDWLFAKLYHVPTFEEDLLAQQIRSFCAQSVADGSADNWFFLRYADPDPHLRIRWHGDPDQLTDRLAPALLRWGSRLVADGFCRRVSVDTYDQEVERYGGPAGTAVAEDLFAADSAAVLELLALVDRRIVTLDRTLLGMVTVDDLVTAFGLTEAERIDLYRNGVLERRATADEYRRQNSTFRSLLGDRSWLASQSGGAAVAEILDRRRILLEAAASRLELLAARGELTRSRPELVRSFVHMHCNRLLGCGHPPEQRVLGLLWRTRESLRHAPVPRRRARPPIRAPPPRR